MAPPPDREYKVYPILAEVVVDASVEGARGEDEEEVSGGVDVLQQARVEHAR